MTSITSILVVGDAMAQVTLYIPDDLAAELRKRSRNSHRSLSSYVTELASGAVRACAWPDGFADLFGSWEGEFPALDDQPPDDVEFS